MPSVAQNAEIISSVVSYAYWGANRADTPLDLRTVLALALTCRAFLEPALDQLWRRQLTLFNLARTLPDNAWEVYDGDATGPGGMKQKLIKSTRVFIPQDWARFDYYAAKIKELGYDPRAPFGTAELVAAPSWRREGVPFDFFTSMCTVRAPYELVPNVRRVRWTTHETALKIRPHVYMFLNAPLTGLTLEFPDASTDPEAPGAAYYKDAVFIRYTLKAITEQCPAFRDVELVWPQIEGYADSIRDFLGAMPQLRTVWTNVQAWQDEDLARLAALPELRRTRLYLASAEFPWLAHEHGTAPFPALVDLTLEAPSLENCTSFFVALGRCQLGKLTVTCDKRPSTPTLHKFLATLAASCTSSTLLTFSLSDIESPSVSSESSDVGGNQCTITSDPLLPLTHFPSLRALMIDVSATYALDDAFPATVLPRWPALEKLSLGKTHRWGLHRALTATATDSTTPRLTLAGLANIVRLAPMLEELCVAIDATSSQYLKADSVRANTRVVSVDLSDSLVPQDEAGAARMSRFLATLFPALERISAKTAPVTTDVEGDVQLADSGESTSSEAAKATLATDAFWRMVEKQVATFAMLREMDMDIPMDVS
ncbi:hypothetical protein C8Q77DRAFT_1161218 [Trametes polyzona]|nr:hypothetical protein C8Q77DRAFT_1161218 [Trametes polyzona]